MAEVTQLLRAIDAGNPKAAEALLPLVYEELRKLAAARMSALPPGQTLQATALVHEAYVRLIGSGPQEWNGRGHFFSAAAEAMRRILVERARQKAGFALTTELLSAALEKIMFVGGSSAFAYANELQRFWRDYNTAARHAIYLPDFGYEVYGAMRLGMNQTVVPPNLV